MIVAYGAGWGWNGLFNFAVVRTHPDTPGRATGITQVGGRLAGAAGPLVFGFVAEHLSYPAAWALDGGAAVAGATIIVAGRQLLVRRLGPGSPAPAPGLLVPDPVRGAAPVPGGRVPAQRDRMSNASASVTGQAPAPPDRRARRGARRDARATTTTPPRSHR